MNHNHLSHTGQYAGVRYCGATDGTSCHLPYVADVVAWAREHITCAACIALLEDVENQLEDAET